MKKSFLLITILAAVLIFPFAINVDKAGADAIMFPWIVQSSSISTLVTVVNTAQGNPDFEERVHLQYWMKNPNGAHPIPDVNDQENTCTELDFKVIVSKDDMFTWDTSGKIGNGEPLFGDANTVPISVNSLDMNAVGQRRAFLLVDNNTAQNFAAVGSNVDGTLYGEAIIVEIGAGAAWGYIAYNPSGGGGSTMTQTSPIIFNDSLDLQGEVIGATEVTQTTLMPVKAMNTQFFLTPVDIANAALDGENQAHNQRVGNANTKVQLCIDPRDSTVPGVPANTTCSEAGIFDNEEGPVSSSINKNIVCTSADDLEALMGGGFTSFRDTNGQGWAYVVTNKGDVDRTGLVGNGAETVDNPSTDMIIGRLEYVDLAKFGFNSGTVNNFAWLRDNATVAGTGGINGIHNCPFIASPSGGGGTVVCTTAQ